MYVIIKLYLRLHIKEIQNLNIIILFITIERNIDKYVISCEFIEGSF